MNLDLTRITGGCRRTFIALVSIVGLFIFGAMHKIDISATVASVAIALAAANGAEKVLSRNGQQKSQASNEVVASSGRQRGRIR